MANIFLDTNYLIFLSGKENLPTLHALKDHTAFISTLTVHIYYYVLKIQVPDTPSLEFLREYNIVDFTHEVLERSLFGPTNDLGDNVQLHSAVRANCDYFVTQNKKLLGMKYFGKMKVVSQIP